MTPQVASAAWWNPFSWFDGWSFLRQSKIETQILEERIKELEKKLDSVATTTATTTVSNSENKSSVQKKETEVPTTNASSQSVQTIKQTSTNTTQSSVPVDKYGMTAADWAKEESKIPQVRLIIADNQKYIDELTSYIEENGSSRMSILKSMSSSGFLDDAGTRLAEKAVATSQEVEMAYRKEMSLTYQHNARLNEVIEEATLHNLDNLKERITAAQKIKDALNAATQETALAIVKDKQAFDAYYYYVKSYYGN